MSDEQNSSSIEDMKNSINSVLDNLAITFERDFSETELADFEALEEYEENEESENSLVAKTPVVPKRNILCTSWSPAKKSETVKLYDSKSFHAANKVPDDSILPGYVNVCSHPTKSSTDLNCYLSVTEQNHDNCPYYQPSHELVGHIYDKSVIVLDIYKAFVSGFIGVGEYAASETFVTLHGEKDFIYSIPHSYSPEGHDSFLKDDINKIIEHGYEMNSDREDLELIFVPVENTSKQKKHKNSRSFFDALGV